MRKVEANQEVNPGKNPEGKIEGIEKRPKEMVLNLFNTKVTFLSKAKRREGEA